jgi:hypothetical protein
MSEPELIEFLITQNTIVSIPGVSDRRIVTAKFQIPNVLSGDLRSFALKELRVSDDGAFFYEDVYKKVHNGSEDKETWIGIAYRTMTSAEKKRFANQKTCAEVLQTYFKKGKPEGFRLLRNYSDAT